MAAAQIKNSFTGIGEIDASISPSSLVLKLAVSTNSLRYFVLNKAHGQVLFYGNYTLHHVSDSAELAQRVQRIYDKDEVLQYKFSEILIGFDSPYTLMPSQLSYMAGAHQLSQRCAENSLDLFFEKDDVLVELFDFLFRQPKYLHLASTYLHLLPHYVAYGEQKLFINVSATHFDVIHFSAEKHLQIMNRYSYKNENDLIYYVLLYCDEMKLNREQLDLIMMGEVDVKSKIYDICFRYFSNINFIDAPTGIGFSKAFDKYPKHLHFNLYNLSE